MKERLLNGSIAFPGFSVYTAHFFPIITGGSALIFESLTFYSLIKGLFCTGIIHFAENTSADIFR